MIEQTSILDYPTTSTPKQAQLPNSTEHYSLDWIKTFEIPWNQLPTELQANVREKKRPLPKLRLKMIRVICKAISKISKHPGRNNLRIIAEAIVNKYPDSFKDTLSGSSLGSRFASIFNQLESRIENQNRNEHQSNNSMHSEDNNEDDKFTRHGFYNCQSR